MNLKSFAGFADKKLLDWNQLEDWTIFIWTNENFITALEFRDEVFVTTSDIKRHSPHSLKCGINGIIFKFNYFYDLKTQKNNYH